MGIVKKKSIAVAIVGTLALSGCVAAPLEFKEPLNSCGGLDLSLTSTNIRPNVSALPYDEALDEQPLTGNLFRIDVLGNASSDSYRVDYQMGLYNEYGFEYFTENPNSAVSGMVERFLPFTAIGEGENIFESRTVDVDRFAEEGSILDFLGLGLDGNGYGPEDVVPLLLPGAFIATCLEGDQSGERVSALQMFPNLTTLVDPQFSLINSEAVMRSSTFGDGSMVFPIVFPVLTDGVNRITLSLDRTTDQWLQLADLFTKLEEAGGDPLPNVLIGDLGLGGATSSDDVFRFEASSLTPGDYNIFVLIVNPESGIFVTAFYESTYSESGFAGFAPFVFTDTTEPVITGSATVSRTAPDTTVATYYADEPVTWSLSRGTERFEITTEGVVRFQEPSTAGEYTLDVVATDEAGNQKVLTVTVTVSAAPGSLHSNFIGGPGSIVRTDDVLRAVFERPGYTLHAWTAMSDGRLERHEPNAESVDSTTSFYAQWRATDTSSLYRNWESSLAGISNGPRVGETVYASAFEREISRGVLRTEARSAVVGDEYTFATPEEYVYRITREENDSSSSVDHQAHSSYAALTEGQQESWYTSLGFDPDFAPYEFSWSAFMCVQESLDVSNNVVRSISKPNGLSLSYASREDGILEDDNFESAFNVMFRDVTVDLYNSLTPTTRTVVGTNNLSYASEALIGGVDEQSGHSWGILDVNADCGLGKTLQAVRIVDSGNSPIVTKNFDIPNELKLEVHPGEYLSVSAVGTTIGVTGAGGVAFNAALWGLTTIASNETTSGGGIITEPPTQVPPITSIAPKKAIIPGFAANSTTLTKKIKKEIREILKANPTLKNVVCKGFTSSPATAQDRILARQRGKAACDFIKTIRPDAQVTIRSGSHTNKPGSQIRRVTIRLS